MDSCDFEYVSGLVLGDGTLYYNERAHEYVVEIYDRDMEFVKLVESLLRNCGFNPHVKSYKTYHRIRVNSKELYNRISTLIPQLLKNPTISFVRGLVDSEGTQYYDNRKRKPMLIVEVANTKQSVISAISMLLDEQNIKYSVKTYMKGGRKPVHKVVIRGVNAYKALQLIKPIHPVKFKY